MKALIVSDIHGSQLALKKALSYFHSFECDKIFILGDTLYHGPRNPLPNGHGPMEVIKLLEPYKEKIIAVRGNCDADVDVMMLDMSIENEYAIVQDIYKENNVDSDINLFLSHGHIFESNSFPKNALEYINPIEFKNKFINAYLYGHTHIYQLETNYKGVLLVNPGSISLPKGGNPPTFAIYDNGNFSIHKLEDGSIFLKKSISLSK